MLQYILSPEEGTLQLDLMSCTEEFSPTLLTINVGKIMKAMFQKDK